MLIVDNYVWCAFLLSFLSEVVTSKRLNQTASVAFFICYFIYRKFHIFMQFLAFTKYLFKTGVLSTCTRFHHDEPYKKDNRSTFSALNVNVTSRRRMVNRYVLSSIVRLSKNRNILTWRKENDLLYAKLSIYNVNKYSPLPVMISSSAWNE